MGRQTQGPDGHPIQATVNGVRHTGYYTVASNVVSVTYQGMEATGLVGYSAETTAHMLLLEMVRSGVKPADDVQ
jgi:hypothetical protein